jgi:hypothetical protein
MAVTPDAGRLKSGQLGRWDLTVSTVANIGPGIDFCIAFGVIAVTAGVAAPLTIIAAGIAVAFLATTVAEFTRAEPSAGSFITYVETGLGPRAGVALVAQIAVMLAVCIAALVRGHLSAAPFSRAHLDGGLTGLSLGFPLALYMFIGWENGPALAEECRDPERTVPRALYISITIGAVLSLPASTVRLHPSETGPSCWRRNALSVRKREYNKGIAPDPGSCTPRNICGCSGRTGIFFARTRHDAGQTPQPRDVRTPGRTPSPHRDLPSMTDNRVHHLVTDLRSRLWASSHGSFSAWSQA